MRIKTIFACLLASLGMSAANTYVSTSSEFTSAYSAAGDGDVIILAEGTYGNKNSRTELDFPNGKTVTIKAADNADVTFAYVFRNKTDGAKGGGIVFENLNIYSPDNYFMTLNGYGDIKEITYRNCDITNVGRCLFDSNSGSANSVKSITIDGCTIHDCGAGGYNLIYSSHAVQKMSVTNSTLYNYTNGESLFYAREAAKGNVLEFSFCNNTVYRWAKSNDRAFCNIGNNYSTESTYTFENNIVYKGKEGYTPQMVQATGGTLVAKNNLVLEYGGYNVSNATSNTVNDLTLKGLGIDALPWPDADNGDFTIPSTSPLATASTTGGVIGAPRWLKTIANAVTFTASADNEAAGSVTPANNTYEAGESVTVTATANYGYRFKEWQTKDGTTVSTDNPYTFTISENTDLVAAFTAVETFTLTVKNLGEGAAWGKVKLSPEPVNGKYETGTEVIATIVPNSVTSFMYWEDSSAEQSRFFTMDGDKEISATFDVKPFIVAWDFNTNGARGNRPADYAFATDNTGNMLFYQGDGSTSNWGPNTKTFGGKTFDCARRYTNYAKDNEAPRSFVAAFSVAEYDKIRIHSFMANDNGTVRKQQLLQYSTTSPTEGFTTLNTLTLEGSSSAEWMPLEAELDTKDINGMVYVRWIEDVESDFIDKKDSETEGLYLADVAIFADKADINDHEAPVLISSSPEEGSASVSAKGNIILNFNERVKAGNGSVTLNGETLQGSFGSKTVIYPYRGLTYGQTYTLNIGDNAITDLNGNNFPAQTLNFTVMTRPQPAARKFDAVVAADGTGDFTTIQDAINAAPEGRIAPYLIFVKNGEYEELVVIPKEKPFIHLIGQDKEKTIIKYFINNGGSSDVGWEYSTNNPESKTAGYQAVVQVNSTDFYTENITYLNRWGVEKQSGPMGLAMSSRADRQAFYNCKFRSYQDTWYTDVRNASDRHYITGCWIEGAVDFFYGAGDIYAENNTFYMARESGSIITAPSHKEETKYGYVFNNNTIEGSGSNHKLGRAWQNKPVSVWLNTTIKTTLSTDGWSEWHIAPKLFAEYNSMDANGNPVDLNNRRTTYKVDEQYLEDGESNPVKRQAVLTAEECAKYTYENVTEGAHKDGWNPRRLFEAVEAPKTVLYNKTTGKLTWEASKYAICYIVIDSNEKVVAITTETDCDLANGTYTVKAANEYGSISDGTLSEEATAVKTVEREPDTNSDNGVYDLTGRKLKVASASMIKGKGIYIQNHKKVMIK